MSPFIIAGRIADWMALLNENHYIGREAKKTPHDAGTYRRRCGGHDDSKDKGTVFLILDQLCFRMPHSAGR